MWQRVHDPETGGLKWVRAPPQNTIVADVKMGYTPRPSFDGAAAVAEAAGEMNMASTIKNGNLTWISILKSTTQNQVKDYLEMILSAELPS